MRSLWFVALVVLGVASCTSDDGPTSPPDQGPDQKETFAEIGPAGGTLAGPAGAGLQVPAGALEETVTVRISVNPADSPELPATAGGMVFAFEPHGQTFDKPVTITLPHTSKPDEVAVYTAPDSDGQWSAIRSGVSVDPAATRIEVTHFSFFFNGREVCGLAYQECCNGGCAGDALTCVENRCLPCGFTDQRCCTGTPRCHETNSRCNTTDDPPPAFDRCEIRGGGDGGSGGGPGGD